MCRCWRRVCSTREERPISSSHMNLALVSDNSSGVGPVFLYSGASLNQTGVLNSTAGEVPIFPSYIRTASTIVCVIIMSIGVAGNAMVPAVILRSRDMRNSTNIFLVNLSVADLLVLLVCTPTVLVEVHSRPEVWLLGETMCKAVPFVELTVAHASVLTILAISFERYYAICEPLRAGYVCTKARAMLICLLAWALAALLTSPVLAISQFGYSEYKDGSVVPTCLTQASTFWPKFFFATSVALFFVVPLGLLLGLYGSIAKRLMCNVDCSAALTSEQGNKRARRQVVLLLGTVVLIFFMCLLPFRALTLWLIFSSDEHLISLGVETYFNILYFCRTMHYLNSALNPILYNVMSSKFRAGFADLCCLRKRRIVFLRGPRGMSEVGSSFLRNGTFHTTASWTSNSCNRPLQAQHRSAPNLLTWRSDSSLSSINSETSFTPAAGTRSIRCTLPRQKSSTHNGFSNTAIVTNSWKGRNSSFRRNAVLRSTMIDLNDRIRKADLNTPLTAEEKV